jgi:serine protease DegQ
VLHNGPAAQGGLRPGDVVVQVAASQVANTSQLLNAVAALKPGETAQVRVQRAGEVVNLNVVVAKRPKAPVQTRNQQDEQ